MLAVSIFPQETEALLELFYLYKKATVWNGLDKFETHNLLTWWRICNGLVQWTSVVMISVLLLASYVSCFLFVWVNWRPG